MKFFVRGTFFCFLALCFLILAAQAGFAGKVAPSVKPSEPQADSAEKPSMHLSEITYDFGQIIEGTEIQHDYIIRNDGKGPLNIDRVKVG